MSHTPGPWTARPDPVRGKCIVTDSRGFELAALNDANARLIAAAPELLAVVKEFYYESGPRDVASKVIPADKYAAMTADEIDAKWDFSSRHEMHGMAKIIAKAGAK